MTLKSNIKDCLKKHVKDPVKNFIELFLRKIKNIFTQGNNLKNSIFTQGKNLKNKITNTIKKWLRKWWVFIKKWWLAIVIAVGILGSAICFPKIWTNNGVAMWNGTATRNLVFVFGALGAVYGLFLSTKRIKISEDNLFNDRLSRAIEVLANENNLSARNAGLRLLRNLAEELPEGDSNRELIYEILHGFIRDRALLPSKDKADNLPDIKESPEQRADIVTAIEVLFGLVLDVQRAKYKLDNLDFRKLNLTFVDFSSANLDDTNLQGANLQGANLNRMELSHSNLQNSNLQNSNLQDAYLWYAVLQNADLGDANLQDATLHDVNLQGANLQNANLQGADLQSADLQSADLRRSNLQGAKLWHTQLHGADLSAAKLQDVENLSQERLDEIIYDENSKPKNLPDTLTLPKHRAYEWTFDNGCCFVESDQPESRNPVNECLAGERKEAEAKEG